MSPVVLLILVGTIRDESKNQMIEPYRPHKKIEIETKKPKPNIFSSDFGVNSKTELKL